MIPYTSEDYRLDFCKEQAATLRQSGCYSQVVVRKKQPEIINGESVSFGRIYVERHKGGK